jgi:hypothetical protein
MVMKTDLDFLFIGSALIQACEAAGATIPRYACLQRNSCT